MANEPYQFESLPPAPPSASAALNVAPKIITRDRFCLGCGCNVRGLRIDGDCPECGRMILSKEPVFQGALPPALDVDESREMRRCEGCGYDLRGLPGGGVCPECGLPKSMPSGASFVDPLSRMPIEIIRHFRMACLVVSGVMLIAIVLLLRAMFGVATPVETGFALLATACAWLGAIWLATPTMSERPGTARGFSSMNWLRLTSRGLQVGWIVAAGCTLVIAKLPTPAVVPVEVFLVLRWIAIAVGLAGVWCFAVLMGNLAEWTRDDHAERLFNLSLWGIPLGTPPLLFVNVGWLLGWSYAALMVRGPMAVVVMLLGLAWVIALLTFPLAMLSLTKSVSLSVMHNQEDQARKRRQMARQVEYDERLTESIDRLNPHPRR